LGCGGGGGGGAPPPPPPTVLQLITLIISHKWRQYDSSVNSINSAISLIWIKLAWTGRELLIAHSQQSYSGTKKSKDRITIALTSNANGSEKFLAWVISKSENPRSFSKINRKDLQVMYWFNNTKWITGLICEEYLRWLNNKMHSEGRKVLL
jgi:hypothetical protein